jgi:hypothetical protein
MYTFWDIVWITFGVFAFAVYFIILASVIGDLFRDRELSGWWKVVWIIFLVWLPYITAFVYLVARGRGMGDRQQAVIDRRQKASARIASDATSSPAAEISRAKALLDDGVITSEEFTKMKERALA